jgi:hypothetical protein
MAFKKFGKKQNNDTKGFIVVRDGHRVSDFEYETAELAADEYGFWQRVIVNGRDFNSKLEIRVK